MAQSPHVQGRGPCSFYLSRDMAETADLIFMPYNYVLDGRTRMTLSSINWQGAAVIFDEAHNVEVMTRPKAWTMSCLAVLLCSTGLVAL